MWNREKKNPEEGHCLFRVWSFKTWNKIKTLLPSLKIKKKKKDIVLAWKLTVVGRLSDTYIMSSLTMFPLKILAQLKRFFHLDKVFKFKLHNLESSNLHIKMSWASPWMTRSPQPCRSFRRLYYCCCHSDSFLKVVVALDATLTVFPLCMTNIYAVIVLINKPSAFYYRV